MFGISRLNFILLLEAQENVELLVSFLLPKSLREPHHFLSMAGPFFDSVTEKFIPDLVYLPGDAARGKGRSVINLIREKCPRVCKIYEHIDLKS